jgi:hypothetical protein
VSVSRATPYERIGPTLAAAGLLVKRGKDCVGRDEPLFKVSLLPDADRPKDRFALLVSMSHALADGHTFYAVHNMLSSATPVVALNPTRVLHAARAIDAAKGTRVADQGLPDPYQGVVILRILTGMLLSKLLGPKTKTAMYLVDDAWVAREKRVAAAEGLVKFVSTNDLVTSTLHPAPCTLNPEHPTLNPEPCTLNPEP